MSEYTPSQLKGDFAIRKRLDGSRGNLIVENSITVGDYLIADADGINLDDASYYATSEKPGLVKPGNALEVKPDGTLDFNGAIDGDVYIFGDGEEGGTATIEKSLTVGDFLIADENGLNADLLPIATTETKGIVKIGEGISVNNGTISLTITPTPASDFAEHVADQSAHGATSTPTAGKIAKFNADGNLESGTPTTDSEVATREFIAEIVRTTVVSVKARQGAVVTIKIGTHTETINADADGFVNYETQFQGDAEIYATYSGVICGKIKTLIVYKYNRYEIDLECPAEAVLYGVRHYVNESSPVLTRLADSENYTFTPETETQFGESSFDDGPIFKDIKLCDVDIINGEIVATYEDDPDFTRTPASGDVCAEIPKFYFWRNTKHLNDAENPFEEFYISDVKFNNDFQVSPAHIDRGDGAGERDKIWIGCYTVGSDNRSVSGATPKTGTTFSGERAAFATRGGNYHILDFTALSTIEILYLVFTANLNSQGVIGTGNLTSGTQLNAGETDILFYPTGHTETGAVKLFGIENLWGNGFEYLDGILAKLVGSDHRYYYCVNPADWALSITANYTEININGAGDWIKKVGFDSSTPWALVSSLSGGSSTTFFCDRVSGPSSTSARSVLIGSAFNVSASNAANYGLFYWLANNNPSGAASTYCEHVLILP